MFYLILATICFSFSFGLIKSQVTTLPVDIVVFLRLFIAFCFLLPFFIVKFKDFSYSQIKKAFLIGIMQFGIMYVCFLRAFHFLQGNEIVLLTASTPLFVIIFSSLFVKKINLKYLLPVFLVMLGAVIVVLGRTTPKILLKGVIYMELSNMAFASGQVLWKKYLPQNASSLIAPAYLGASLLVLPFACFNDISSFSPNLLQWSTIIYLGVVPTGIGFWLWAKGVKKVSYPVLSVMNNLKILFGVIFAFLIFHEKTNLSHFIVGTILIIFALIYTFYLDKNTTKNFDKNL